MELQREEEISVEINLPLGEVWLFRLEREGFSSMRSTVSPERECVTPRTPCLCSHRTPLGGRESIPEGHGQGPVTPPPFLDEWMLEAFG